MKHGQLRLVSKVGKKHQDVVLKCLWADFRIVDDTEEDLKLQQEFRSARFNRPSPSQLNC